MLRMDTSQISVTNTSVKSKDGLGRRRLTLAESQAEHYKRERERKTRKIDKKQKQLGVSFEEQEFSH